VERVEVTVYVDTQVLVWTAEGNGLKMGAAAVDALENADLLASPAAVLELEYLYEIGHINKPAEKILFILESAIGLRVCGLPFREVVTSALHEKWTRDPFDRLIVANAKAASAPLVTNDERIRKHYRRCIW
jgi:PIN domain nuclease of toxin-antitoxin system